MITTSSSSIAKTSKAAEKSGRLLMIGLISASVLFTLAFFSNEISSLGSWLSGNTPEPQQAALALVPSEAQGNNEEKSVSDVVNSALSFYNLLNSTQQNTLQLTYTTALARKWSNLPCGTSCRNGIQLGTNLTSSQYVAAMQVVKDALSATNNDGYDEWHQMNLAEAYLHANGGSSGYDSTLRWMAFLNTPSSTGPWMLQFGGHHYAANIAFNNGHVIGATPFFMGLEPKTFTYAGTSYDPLGDERDAFRAALGSLSSTQLSTAHINSSFSDCVMIPGETNGGTSSFPSASIGQPLSALSTDQQNLVLAVIEHYVGDMDSATYNSIMAVYAAELSSTYISYRGSGTAGSATSFLTAQGDYARISGPNVWIEFSCQGGIVIQGQIHYHTVWRDRSHDYGVDLSGDAIDDHQAGVAEVASSPYSMKLFPNPANSFVQLTLDENVSNAAIMITDINGRIVFSKENFTGNKLQLDVSNYSEGTYVTSVRDKKHFYSAKFTKEN